MKTTGLLLSCVLGVSLTLIGLFFSSPLTEAVRVQPFVRTFVSQDFVVSEDTLNLEYNSFYIAGITANKVFLGNWTSPFHLLVSDYTLSDTQHLHLTVNGASAVMHKRKFRVEVDSPYFFLLNGVWPRVYRGLIGDWSGKRFMPDSAFFVDAIVIGPRSLALRSYNLSNGEFELAKERVSHPYFEFRDDVLEKQVDGLFCVQGSMHLSRDRGRIIYIYSFRNEYIVLDTNLNVLNRFNTLDTFRHANVAVASIEGRHQVMLSRPPASTNGHSATWSKFLFVQSPLLAKNGDREKFKRAAVVDAYDFIEGTYRFSFYVPNFRNQRMRDFRVTDRRLVALYERELIVFTIDPTTLPVTQEFKAEHLNKPR